MPWPSKKKPKPINSARNLVVWGLAILVAAVFIIWFLFNFSPRTDLSSECVSRVGYICQSQNITFFHGTVGINAAGAVPGNILVTVGQNTGINWISANFVFVPQGTSTTSGIPNISFINSPANTFYATTGLASEQTVSVYLPVNGTKSYVSIGTLVSGTIWAQYTTSSNQTPKNIQIAYISFIKAT